MTELSALTLPEWLAPAGRREEVVAGHRVCVPERWWRDAISRWNLPGDPPAGSLTRASVWAPADDVFTLLWRVLAWGSGSRLRHNRRRLAGIAADVAGSEDLLRRAAELAVTGSPAEAFAVFRPAGRNVLPGLGPSFFTKFLYFAGQGVPEHRCVILDRVVATVLRKHCGWDSLHPVGGWPAVTYQRYCDLLARWAQERDRAADEIEYALFTSKGQL